LVVKVDEGQRDQEPREHDGRRRRPTKSVLPGYGCRENARKGFDDRIACADMGAAIRTTAPEHQVADDRDVLQGGNGCITGRASRARYYQVEGLPLLRRLGAMQLGTLLAPLTVEDNGHAIDDDVQEAADEQAEHQAGADEQWGRGRQKLHD